MRDYDPSLFEIIILETLDSEPDLPKYEAAWIEYLSSTETNVGYNVQKQVNSRWTMSEEKREELSVIGKARKKPMTEERREQFRAWGRKGADVSRQRMKCRV